MRNLPVCFPVWAFSHCADPYRAAIEAITSGGYEPEREAALVQSVIDMLHAAQYQEKPAPFSSLCMDDLRDAVNRLEVCHG